jgi:hypothetical protein
MIPTQVVQIITNFVDSFTTIGDQCYIWKGITNTSGIPYINFREHKGGKQTSFSVTRIVYDYYCGELKGNRDYVLQTCGNKLCIRPEHLYLGRYTSRRNEKEPKLSEINLIGLIRISEDLTSFVERTDYCWNWTGTINKFGYGIITHKYYLYFVHRLAYVKHFGSVPENMFVLHKCDNRKCINPEHLFIGTNRDNVDDMLNKERQPRGETKHNSILLERDILLIRKMKQEGETLKDISKYFNVSEGAIYDVIARRTWKHIK